jgi:cytochrome c-type biogenesis protein
MTPEMVLAASTANTVTSGSLLLAIPVAFAAGVVSFLSPCVLPLVPGYIGYITGLTGAEIAQTTAQEGEVEAVEGSGTTTAVKQRTTAAVMGKVTLGTLLFVAGFSVVFVATGALFGALGAWLLEWADVLQRGLGVIVIIMGLAYLGWLPGLQREWRVHKRVPTGLWGAPLLGLLFGLGWTPCIGPTLAAVQALAFSEASAARGALLSLAYALGLGLPFLIVGLLLGRAYTAVRALRRHQLLLVRIGGAMLIIIGVLLVTGVWQDITIAMRTWVSGFGTAL